MGKKKHNANELGQNKAQKSLDFLQSAFSLKILLVLSQPAPLQTTTLLRRSHAWVRACSNFAKKNKRLLAV